jgi:hypothetical protein
VLLVAAPIAEGLLRQPSRAIIVKEVRIMGSKSVLLRTLVAASSGKTARFAAPSFVPKWRAISEYAIDAECCRFCFASLCDGRSFFGVGADVPTWLHAFVQHPHYLHQAGPNCAIVQ